LLLQFRVSVATALGRVRELVIGALPRESSRISVLQLQFDIMRLKPRRHFEITRQKIVEDPSLTHAAPDVNWH
jgi:hypothetical protein